MQEPHLSKQNQQNKTAKNSQTGSFLHKFFYPKFRWPRPQVTSDYSSSSPISDFLPFI